MRRTLFGFIYVNSNIFLPHIEKKYKCTVEIREYCLWIPVKSGEQKLSYLPCYKHLCIHTQMSVSKSYQWSKFPPLSPPSRVVCDYPQKLVHMPKPSDYHLELFHFGGRHYDLIVSEHQENRLSCLPLSDFTCNVVCE